MSTIDMDFKTVPFTKVNDALEEKKVTGIEQRSYNTCFHKQEEIAAVLPDTEHKPPHSVQPWILLEPWLDVIMKTRNLHEADVHRIKLPGSFLAVLCSAFAIGIYMGRINASDAEDMEACFPKTTTRGIDISQLLRTGRYFVRLDTCSLKDAVAGGKGPVTSAQQLWTRLATSHRGCSGVMAMRAYDISAPIYLYLFPWDDNMRTELEYRVFCPPYSERIAAISQYRWHDRWQHADESTPDQRTVAERVLNGAEAIHRQLIDHPAMTEELKRSGFTFDIAVELGGENVRLIELNDFGAMSGCGSCLFQWIEDARVLYGKLSNVEFRVAC